MLRMFARRWTQKSVAAGSDEIIFGVSLPAGSVVHDINAEVLCHFVSDTPLGTVTMYGVEGYLLPVFDPDSGASFETIWDQLVPKDSDTESVDLDTSAADTGPFFEPGEPSFQDMLDVGLVPKRIYRRERMLHIGNGSVFSFRQQAGDTIRWVPGDQFKIRVKRRIRVKVDSILVFGFASPSLDDHTGTFEKILDEFEWPQVKYMSETMRRALLHLIGLTEAGAETPWEEATALLKKHLEPDMIEETANSWTGSTWTVATRAIIDHSTIGEFGVQVVSTQ